MSPPQSKRLLRLANKGIGQPMRSMVRNFLVHPLITANYKVTITGAEAALSCSDGAIVLSNHISRIDAIVLMSEAWPYARVWPTVWYSEYQHPLQRPFMWLFSAIPLGSPPDIPPAIRQRRKRAALQALERVLWARRHLLIFPEGGVGDGRSVRIRRSLTGVYDLIKSNPHKPVLMVRINGLEQSVFGKRALPWYKRIPRRLPVAIVIERFDHVSLEGGHESLNERIERYYVDGTPLA